MRVVTSPVLVGRGEQLAELSEALDALTTGVGRMVLLSGPAGAGKSRLVHDVLQSRADVRTVVGHCRAAGQQPYRPIAELVLGLSRSGRLAPTPTVLSELVAVAGHPPPPLQVAAALVDWLGGAQPIALVVEDLHWADPETADVLATVTGQLAGVPVLVLATVRDDEYDDGLVALRRRPEVLVVDVPRMSEQEVREVAEACLGSAPSAALVEALVSRAEGIPLLVEELLASLLAAGAVVQQEDTWELTDASGAGVPISLATGVQSRLAQLTDAQRELLAAAALLGRSFDWRLLGPALDLDPTEVAAGLDAARRLQLIEADPDVPGGLRFRHALTADAVDVATFAPDRARIAAALLSHLERREEGLHAELSRAAQLARAAGEPARAAGLLVLAAKQAFDRSALRSALQLLAEAESLVEADDPVATRVGEELLRVLTLTGRMTAARQLAEALWPKLVDDPDGRRRVEVALRLAKSTTELGDLEVARVAVERAAAHVQPDGEVCHPSRVHLARGELHIAAGEHAAAHAELASALELTWPDDPARPLDQIGDVEAYTRVALAGLLRSEGRPDDARTELSGAEHMTYVCDLPVIRARALAVSALLDFDAGVAPVRLDEARELALAGGATELWVRLELFAATTAALRGDLADAADLAERAARGARDADLGRHLDAAETLTQALAHLAAGEPIPGSLLGNQLAGELVAPLLRQQADRAARSRAVADIPQQLARRGVTAREAEVAELVAAGLTNREIGGRLFVSVRTVDKHVERLLTKLDAPNRAALAAVVAGTKES